MLAQSFFWKLPETETVILRPVHILGAVHNAPSNFLRLNPILTVMGFDPMAQVIQQADVVRAIELALRPGIRGIFNLAGPEPVPLSPPREDPRPPAHQRALLARARRPPPHVVPAPHDVPAAGARPHPLRLHGRRPPRTSGARVHAADVARGDRALGRRRALVTRAAQRDRSGRAPRCARGGTPRAGMQPRRPGAPPRASSQLDVHPQPGHDATCTAGTASAMGTHAASGGAHRAARTC